MFVKTQRMLVAVSALIAMSIAHADNFGADLFGADPEKATVGDMLLLDAQRAVIAEQQLLASAQSRSSVVANAGVAATAPAPDAAPVPVAPQLPITLDGIFGLGNNLMADVSIGNTKVRYVRGKKMPVGAPDGFPYKLVSIEVPCVKLLDAANAEQKVCLNSSAY